MQSTSIEAYRDIRKTKINRSQSQVLNLFLAHPSYNYTNNEISKILHMPINEVTPRVYELRGEDPRFPDLVKNPLLVEAAVRKCNVTGRNCKAWKLNTELEI